MGRRTLSRVYCVGLVPFTRLPILTPGTTDQSRRTRRQSRSRLGEERKWTQREGVKNFVSE